MSFLKQILRPLWSHPYLLLIVTMAMWGSNVAVVRASAGHVPPFALAFWRWLFSALLMLIFALPYLRRDWPVLRANKGLVIALGLTGITLSSLLTVLALQYTTALNASLMQATAPICVALWTAVLLRHWLTPWQAIGIAVSIAGVVVIVAEGNLEILRHLAFHPADMLVVLGMFIFGLYSPLTTRMPNVHPFSLFTVMHVVGTLFVAGFYGWEIHRGTHVILDLKSTGIFLYVILFGSVISVLTYNRAVEMIGPNRSAQFLNLIPLFGSLTAVAFIGERLHLYHVVGYLLIVAGVFAAARR